MFEEIDLELPASVIGVFGENGAGKSTLVESVLFALYGQARTPKQEIRTHGILTDCEVRLVFEHGATQYEVRRTIRGKNHATDAELFAAGSSLAVGVSDVNGEVRRLLRMDHQVFRSSVFAEQKQLDAFSDLTKAKRQEMVLRLLGIKPVDDARAAARKESRDTKADAERLAGSLPDLEEPEKALDGARNAAEEASARASQAKEALQEATERARIAEEAFRESDRTRERVDQIAIERRSLEEQVTKLSTRRTDLESRIEELRRDVDRLPLLEEEQTALADAGEMLMAARRLTEFAEEARQIESELEALPDLDAQVALAVLKAAEEEREAARETAARAKSELERAQDDLALAQETLERAGEAEPSEPCPTCGRPLGDDFKQYVAHCKEEARGRKRAAQAATKAHRDAVGALNAAEAKLRDATMKGEAVRRAVDARGSLTAHLEKARAKIAEASEAFGGNVPDPAELEARAKRAKEVGQELSAARAESKHLAKAEGDLEHLAGDFERSSRRIDDLNREEAELAFDPEDHGRLRKEHDEARRILDEVRAEEREVADRLTAAQATVKELQAEIRKVKEMGERVAELRDDARYLERVSLLLDGFRDHLVGRIGPELSREAEALFHELTNHEYDDLRIREEDLSIQIADGGAYFDIDRFSGSETDLANLALRVAISMHLSRVSGADIGMMVLDEVLGSLDAERKDLMVQAMGKLSARFHQLFVITHAEQIKDQFPASIQVRKAGRRRSTAVLV